MPVFIHFVGILFSITLLWAFCRKNGQKTWYNILVECLYIVGGGASIGFVAFLFCYWWQNVSFRQKYFYAKNIDTGQPTFNGLSRRAMVLGMPVLAIAACGFVSTMLMTGLTGFPSRERHYFSAASYTDFMRSYALSVLTMTKR